MANLQVEIGRLKLKNPVLVASGTFGYGDEFQKFFDVTQLGGIITKGISLEPREGNLTPRLVEIPSGVINSIGLQNPGVEGFLENKVPLYKNWQVPIIVNVFGKTIQEYCRVTEKVCCSNAIAAIELNVSCPNVKKGGMEFGVNPKTLEKVVGAVRAVCPLPLIVKLSPHVTDIRETAQASEGAGADAISIANTYPSLSIDIHRRLPRISTGYGGLSGPAIKPIVLRLVWEAYRAIKIPIIGVGGISTVEDALEYIIAGSRAIQIGTANFVDPLVSLKVIQGLSDFLEREKIASISDIVGTLQWPQ